MSQRKIIHIDADAFYASIEMREQPQLAQVPLAVGGSPSGRGVVATCNYQARKFGVRSAMPSSQALRLCPDLQFVKPNFTLYKQVSAQMRQIFQRYTELIEPLSLDEAYLDVSHCEHFQGSATRIAQAIMQAVARELRITVSAGVAPNKFLAKIASDWQKPNGLFVIRPDQVDDFVRKLSVNKINGVGKVTHKKLLELGIETCQDLRDADHSELIRRFGKQGQRLINMAQGIDERPVQVSRIRKSLSVEHTYEQDLATFDEVAAKVPVLVTELSQRLNSQSRASSITKRFIKLKFNDFNQTTLEQMHHEGQCYEGLEQWYTAMLATAWKRQQKPVRLVGVGVRFDTRQLDSSARQLSLFET